MPTGRAGTCVTHHAIAGRLADAELKRRIVTSSRISADAGRRIPCSPLSNRESRLKAKRATIHNARMTLDRGAVSGFETRHSRRVWIMEAPRKRKGSFWPRPGKVSTKRMFGLTGRGETVFLMDNRLESAQAVDTLSPSRSPSIPRLACRKPTVRDDEFAQDALGVLDLLYIDGAYRPGTRIRVVSSTSVLDAFDKWGSQ